MRLLKNPETLVITKSLAEGGRRSNLYHIDFNKARLLHGVYPEMTNEGFAMTTFSAVSNSLLSYLS